MGVISVIEDDSKVFAKSLTLEDHLLVVLMKLKLGLFNRDILNSIWNQDTGNVKNILLPFATTC